jgi:hypothetical protein
MKIQNPLKKLPLDFGDYLLIFGILLLAIGLGIRSISLMLIVTGAILLAFGLIDFFGLPGRGK